MRTRPFVLVAFPLVATLAGCGSDTADADLRARLATLESRMDALSSATADPTPTSTTPAPTPTQPPSPTPAHDRIVSVTINCDTIPGPDPNPRDPCDELAAEGQLFVADGFHAAHLGWTMLVRTPNGDTYPARVGPNGRGPAVGQPWPP